MKTGILGLDPGLTHTGYAYLLGDTETKHIKATESYGVLETKKWRNKAKTVEIPPRERIDQISLDIQKLVAELEPRVVVVEDFVYYGNKGKTTSLMPALIENIRMLGRALGYEAAIYTNGYWKQILLKNHQATKEQVQHYVHKALGLDASVWDARDRGGHIRDAMAIGLTEWTLSISKDKRPEGGKKHDSSAEQASYRWY